MNFLNVVGEGRRNNKTNRNIVLNKVVAGRRTREEYTQENKEDEENTEGNIQIIYFKIFIGFFLSSSSLDDKFF